MHGPTGRSGVHVSLNRVQSSGVFIPLRISPQIHPDFFLNGSTVTGMLSAANVEYLSLIYHQASHNS